MKLKFFSLILIISMVASAPVRANFTDTVRGWFGMSVQTSEVKAKSVAKENLKPVAKKDAQIATKVEENQRGVVQAVKVAVGKALLALVEVMKGVSKALENTGDSLSVQPVKK